MQISVLKYKPREIKGFLDNNKRIEWLYKRTLGHIILPIPDGVTDQNKVDFGSSDSMDPASCWFKCIALKRLLKGIGEDGLKTAGDDRNKLVVIKIYKQHLLLYSLKVLVECH